MSDFIKVRVGEFTIIDDGNGIYNPTWDPQDKIVDSNNNLISEKDDRVQALLANLGLATFEGTRVKSLNDYIVVINKEKAALKQPADGKELAKHVDNIRLSAYRVGAHGNAVVAQVIRSLGEQGYLVALAVAKENANTGELSEMDAMLDIAINCAKEYGKDILGEVEVIARAGYKKLFNESVASAQKHIKDKDSEWLDQANRDLNTAVACAKSKAPGSEKPLFKNSEDIIATLEGLRTKAYREATAIAITDANTFVAQTKNNDWLYNAIYTLRMAEALSIKGKIAPEFAQQIVDARRAAYTKGINMQIAKATAHVAGKDGSWLDNANYELNQAIKLAKGSINTASGETTLVFDAAQSKQLIDSIEAKRKEFYREAINLLIGNATTIATKASGDNDWLYNFNDDLKLAWKLAQTGQVAGEFAPMIRELQRTGYAKAIDIQIARATAHVTKKGSDWLYYAEYELNDALKLANNETVFDAAATKKLVGAIEAKRMEFYRVAVTDTINIAIDNINNAGSDWLYNVNYALKIASQLAQKGKVASEFDGKITEVRRSGYMKAINIQLAAADVYLKEKGRDWLYNADYLLNQAVKLANDTVDGTKTPVFDDAGRAKILATIDAKRKDCYRAAVNDAVAIANSYIEKGEDNWYYYTNDTLQNAKKLAKQGQISAEFDGKFAATIKAALKKAFDISINSAKQNIKDQNYSYALSNLRDAQKVLDAKMPDTDKPAFSDTEKAEMQKKIDELKVQIK